MVAAKYDAGKTFDTFDPVPVPVSFWTKYYHMVYEQPSQSDIFTYNCVQAVLPYLYNLMYGLVLYL